MSSTAKVISCFDVISPYSFICMEALTRYEKYLPAQVQYIPVFLGAIIVKSGNVPPAKHPGKGTNMKNDIQYASNYWGLKMRWPSDFELTIVKRGSVVPQRFLTAVEQHEPKYLIPAAKAFGSKVWEKDEPIHLEEHVLEVADQLKIPDYKKLLEESKSEGIKELYRKRTEEAMKTGAFGIPWLILKQEGKESKTFFGSDRLHYLCNELGVEFKGPLRGNSLSNDPDLPIERAKKAAAFACGEVHIKSGMKIGVGSGSTVKYLVEFLKEKHQQKILKDIVCVPTSFMTRKWLIDAGLPVSTLEEHSELDVAIDGADEVDSRLNLIKGGGGCLTQEKIVQSCSKSFIVIADANKKSTNLGDRYKVLPIEVVPTAYVPAQKWIKQLFGGSTSIRISATKCFPLITDNGNYIIEWNFPKGVDRDWTAVHQALVNLPGVVETGLFLKVTNAVYFAKEDGQIEVVKP